MSYEAQTSMPRYAVVTVTYNPDIVVLRRQLSAIASPCVVLVDDGSDGSQRDALRRLVQQYTTVVLVCNTKNLGLAAGLNIGAKEALQRLADCEYLVFLDQDTEPGDAGVERLVQATARLRAADGRVGLVGPQMVDAETGLSHGIHVIRAWRWTRVFPRAGDAAAVACASVNGSGSVVHVEVFRELGGFDESLFIDHVDTEWSFRVAAAGYALYTVPGVRFSHRMGERSIRFWLGGWRLWPYRAASRHFTIFRNTVLLMKRGYVPRVWKGWAAVKLVATALVHLVADPERFAQLRQMLRGLLAGLRGADRLA